MKIVPQEVTYVDLAYLAGSLEADGCWFVGNSVSVRLTNKSIKLLQWCVETFGGEIKSKSTPTNCFEWTLHGQAAIHLTKQLLPYLHSKEEEVSFWLQYGNTIQVRGKKLTDDVRSLRTHLKTQVKKARQRRNGENC